jgi:hypothetical protein
MGTEKKQKQKQNGGFLLGEIKQKAKIKGQQDGYTSGGTGL